MAIIKGYRDLDEKELESAKELLQFNYKIGLKEYLSDKGSSVSTNKVSKKLAEDMLERLKVENVIAYFDSNLGTIFGFIIGKMQKGKGIITNVYVDYIDVVTKKDTTLKLFKRILTEFQSQNVHDVTMTVDKSGFISNEVVEKLGFTNIVTLDDVSCYEKRI